MTPYTHFLPNLYVRAPEVPEPSAVIAVRDTCIDFCAQTNVWQVELDPIVLDPCQSAYDLFPPPQTITTEILGMTLGHRDLQPISETSLRLDRHNWQHEVGEPRNFMRRPGDDRVFIYPRPRFTYAHELCGTISVQPTRESKLVIDDVYQRYAEIIVNGALSRLYMHVGTAYSNPQAARELDGLYQEATNRARKDIKLAYNPAPAYRRRRQNH